MVYLDQYGWPVERIKGHRFINFIRLILWTRNIVRGKWDGYKVISAWPLKEKG